MPDHGGDADAKYAGDLTKEMRATCPIGALIGESQKRLVRKLSGAQRKPVCGWFDQAKGNGAQRRIKDVIRRCSACLSPSRQSASSTAISA